MLTRTVWLDPIGRSVRAETGTNPLGEAPLPHRTVITTWGNETWPVLVTSNLSVRCGAAPNHDGQGPWPSTWMSLMATLRLTMTTRGRGLAVGRPAMAMGVLTTWSSVEVVVRRMHGHG